MKKQIIIFSIIIFIFFCTSCLTEEGDNCKRCKQVTYENGDKVSTSLPQMYCDEDLEAVESEGATTVGDRTIEWECN